jgi:hypothetical protein
VEGRVAEKRMAAQVELMEVGRLHAHAHDECSGLLAKIVAVAGSIPVPVLHEVQVVAHG